MRVREIMTSDPACCTPDHTAREAAQLMRENDCGCAPVVEDLRSRRVIGVITDRDLAIRGLADGKGPETPIRELMSSDTRCCVADADLGQVEQIMAERQVRRVPVIDGAGSCIGIVAQADLARGGRVSDREVALVVERISEPTTRAARELRY